MLFGIDISGSMDMPIANTNITCAEGALALAKVLSLQAESYSAFGFNVRYTPIDLCPPLGNVLRAARPWFGGATDCSLPMTFATQQRLPVDVFVVLTDNETNANTIAPAEALRKYRKAMQIDAKLVVVAMTAGEISIADPNDSGMLDCVGFDSALPEVIQSFLGIGGSDYAE
jgi:60 kDa SS-A/Ro ribonucleoprotein